MTDPTQNDNRFERHPAIAEATVTGTVPVLVHRPTKDLFGHRLRHGRHRARTLVDELEGPHR